MTASNGRNWWRDHDRLKLEDGESADFKVNGEPEFVPSKREDYADRIIVPARLTKDGRETQIPLNNYPGSPALATLARHRHEFDRCVFRISRRGVGRDTRIEIILVSYSTDASKSEKSVD